MECGEAESFNDVPGAESNKNEVSEAKIAAPENEIVASRVGYDEAGSEGDLCAAEMEELVSLQLQMTLLQADNVAEAARASELEQTLAATEAELSKTEPFREELLEAERALATAEAEECRCAMMIEDSLARYASLLESREPCLRSLEQSLGKDTLPDRDEEEIKALHAATSQLSHRARCLGEDVRSALEYIVTTNVEACGDKRALVHEDLLPSAVRGHLALSVHSSMLLKLVMRRYLPSVEDRPSGDQRHPLASASSSILNSARVSRVSIAKTMESAQPPSTTLSELSVPTEILPIRSATGLHPRCKKKVSRPRKSMGTAGGLGVG